MAKKPDKHFRIGSITATVWGNQNGQGNHFYSVNISRSYKDGEEWKQSDSFGHGDLLNVAAVSKRAEAWIAENT